MTTTRPVAAGEAAGSAPDRPGEALMEAMADALLAARLVALDTMGLGGLWLRGAGPARDRVLAELAAVMGDRPQRRMPASIDDEGLLGGLDFAATLSAGRAVRQAGLLEEAAGGVVLAPMAERMTVEIAGKIAQAMDDSGGFGLVLLDDGVEDEAPPASLAERVAFHLDLGAVDREALRAAGEASSGPLAAPPVWPVLDEEQTRALAITALALGVDSGRAMVLAARAARAHAALAGRAAVSDADTLVAARLVLAPRATRIPAAPPEEQAEAPPEPPEPPESNPDDPNDQAMPDEVQPLDERVLEAALASVPDDLLARIGEGRPARRASGGGGSGRKRASRLRGRPLGARPGIPRGGLRLALIDTLRAAAPWQEIRRRQEAADARKKLRIRKDDVAIRRFEERAEALTIFAVDASGSSAFARLAEAKGAVELMLAQAYVKRAQVALIAFRGTEAELLLPPTRSLTRARRRLAELPGGGGTPLAAGIDAAVQLAEAQAARGRTPFLALLTDGKANVRRDGSPGRAEARAEAESAARRAAMARLNAVVIDISPRSQPEAEAVARAMGARYLALPRADARTVQQAVSTIQFAGAA